MSDRDFIFLEEQGEAPKFDPQKMQVTTLLPVERGKLSEIVLMSKDEYLDYVIWIERKKRHAEKRGTASGLMYKIHSTFGRLNADFVHIRSGLRAFDHIRFQRQKVIFTHLDGMKNRLGTLHKEQNN